MTVEQDRSNRRPGADSVTWRINRVRACVLSWPRAILLQLAHPLIGTAIAHHSTFRRTPLAPASRLRATVRAMLELTFGSPATAQRAVARIRGIHDHVNGVMPSDAGRYRVGTVYSAHDPALLTWVQLTLLDSVPRAYESLVGPLDARDRDAYCVESRPVAEQLGIPAGVIPDSFSEVERRIARAIADGTLVLTDETRSLGLSLLQGPMMTLLFPAAHVVRLLTLGWLPPELRRAYGFQWTSRDASAFFRWCGRARRFHERAPERLTTWAAARRAEARHIHVVNIHP